MVKLKYLIISFCVFSFFACKETVDPYPNGEPLDVQKLVEMRYKWKNLNIKNYSFTYQFDTWQPRYCVGYVIVKDGVGTVTFDTEFCALTPDKNDRFYYIASMEDVFENILDKYLNLKNQMDEGKIKYLDYYAGYDQNYFFLNYAVRDTFGPKVGAEAHVRKSHVFRIRDFKVLG